MMKIQPKRCALLHVLGLLLGCVPSVHAQAVRILTTRDGLPQSFVSGLVQDTSDFVWIGTRNGLARYDGIQFKVFQHDIRDTSSLASNLIISMQRDRKGGIWIEHESGEIDRLDPTKERIAHFPMQDGALQGLVRKGWLVDANGILWRIVKAGGIQCYDSHTQAATRFTKASHNLPSDTLRALLEDSKLRLWVLSEQGISLLDNTSGHSIHYRLPTAQDFNGFFAADEEIVDLHERKNGELMWGDRNKLFFFNPINHAFRTVPLLAKALFGLRWIRTGPDGLEYFESGGSIYRYEETTGLTRLPIHGPEHLLDARSFMVDRAGLVWIGTNAEGIYQLDLATPFFPAFPNREGFHQDLLKQELGLPVAQIFDWKSANERYSAASYYFRSVYDRQGRIWMSLKRTVCQYDFQTKNLVVLPAVPLTISSDDNGVGIKGITVNTNGEPVVVGYNGQVLTYNSSGGLWHSVMDAYKIRTTYGKRILPQDIYMDGARLWITTEQDGLLYIDPAMRQVHQIKSQSKAGALPTNQLLGILPDPSRRDLLWIGSYQGLICFNKRTLTCKTFSLREGLPDNTVYSLDADRAGQIWLTTNKGLCRFNPVTHQIDVFRTSNGLPGDEFNRFHHFIFPDGRLAFGGMEGWTLFDPQSIKMDSFRPKVAFTGLKVNNAPLDSTPAARVPALPINALRSLTFLPDQNTLAFEFAGLEFNQPQNLWYRYRLTGFDEDWVQASHTPVATYTKLPPGTYTLRINASNTSGAWSSHIREIKLIVEPPWWRTWWAFIGYTLLLANVIWLFIRYSIKREVLAREVRLKEREAEQLRLLDEVKTRFFSNITHEFRTPLTLILSPIQSLQGRLLEPEAPRWLATIERNAQQLLRLINQLMDMARLESGNLKVNETSGSLYEVLERIVDTFKQEAETRGIALTLYCKDVTGNFLFDSEKLEQIAGNLIANALKFTLKEGEISIELEANMRDSLGGVTLAVRDKGIGIPPEKLPYIFNRFYQVDDPAAGYQAGSGIGLSFVKELVDLQGGRIEVSSPGSDGWHTKFTVWLPLQSVSVVSIGKLPSIQLPVGSAAILHRLQRMENVTEDETVILIVEDNAELATFIADCLPLAYKVRRASNGAEGLTMAYDLIPDLVITDVLMPVMDGFILCQKLKADEQTSHIPVILLTAKAAFKDRIEGLTLGADDYLTKPFHVEELQLRVANQLEGRRRLREKMRQKLSHPALVEVEHQPVALPALDPFLEKLYAFVEQHLDDTSYGVEELLLDLGMSRTSLHRKITALTGMPITEVMRNYRLKRAAQLLEAGFKSAETGYKVGFASPAYFSKCFRDVYEVSPLEYAQQVSKSA